MKMGRRFVAQVRHKLKYSILGSIFSKAKKLLEFTKQKYEISENYTMS